MECETTASRIVPHGSSSANMEQMAATSSRSYSHSPFVVFVVLAAAGEEEQHHAADARTDADAIANDDAAVVEDEDDDEDEDECDCALLHGIGGGRRRRISPHPTTPPLTAAMARPGISDFNDPPGGGVGIGGTLILPFFLVARRSRVNEFYGA